MAAMSLEASGKTAMTDGFGGVPLSTEVHPFQAEISSNQRLTTGRGFAGWRNHPRCRRRSLVFGLCDPGCERSAVFRRAARCAQSYTSRKAWTGEIWVTKPKALRRVRATCITSKSIKLQAPDRGRSWQLNCCNAAEPRGLFFVLQEFTVGNPPKYRGLPCLP